MTRSSQRSEYILIKNSLLGALSASAVNFPSPLHRRDAEFAEIGVFIDQEVLTLPALRLRGKISEFLFTEERQSSQEVLIAPQR